MNDKINKIEELKKRVDHLDYQDYSEADAVVRKACLLIKHFFGVSSDYLDEIEEIIFPNSDPMRDMLTEKLFDTKPSEWALAKSKMTNLLNTMIEDLKMTASRATDKTRDVKKRIKPKSNRIFVVHGLDEAMKEAVARALEKLGLKPIILHEKPDKGRTVIEKISDYSDVSFAVVLLSADDFGCSRAEGIEKGKFRARQNVIFELGFFIGKLGRKNVLPIFREEDNFDMLSDYKGVIYTPFDNKGQWKFKIVKELKACGYKVDANKII